MTVLNKQMHFLWQLPLLSSNQNS